MAIVSGDQLLDWRHISGGSDINQLVQGARRVTQRRIVETKGDVLQQKVVQEFYSRADSGGFRVGQRKIDRNDFAAAIEELVKGLPQQFGNTGKRSEQDQLPARAGRPHRVRDQLLELSGTANKLVALDATENLPGLMIAVLSHCWSALTCQRFGQLRPVAA